MNQFLPMQMSSESKVLLLYWEHLWRKYSWKMVC